MKNANFSVKESSEIAQVGDFIRIVDVSLLNKSVPKSPSSNHYCGRVFGQIVGKSADNKRFIVKLLNRNPDSMYEIVVPELSFQLIFKNDLNIYLGDVIKYENNIYKIIEFDLYNDNDIKIRVENYQGEIKYIHMNNFKQVKKISEKEYNDEISIIKIHKIEEDIQKLSEFNSIINDAISITKKYSLNVFYPENTKMLRFVESIASIKSVNDLSEIQSAVNIFNEGMENKYSGWYNRIRKFNDILKVITADFYEKADMCYVLDGDGISEKLLSVVDKMGDDMVSCLNMSGDRNYNKNVFNIFPVINVKNADRILSTFNKKMSDLVNTKHELQESIAPIAPQKTTETIELSTQKSDDEFLLQVISSINTDEEKAKQIKEYYSKKK
jgi:hypothetical protein